MIKKKLVGNPFCEGLCDLQLPLLVLRIPRWRREHHDGDQGKEHKVSEPTQIIVILCFLVEDFSKCNTNLSVLGPVILPARVAWLDRVTTLAFSGLFKTLKK